MHAPDLFDGRQPESIEAGVDLVRTIGEQELDERAGLAVDELPEALVYGG